MDKIFTIITMLGEQYFIIAVISLVYWNISKQYGFILSFSFLVSVASSEILKLLFHTKRPFEVLENLYPVRMETALGYSFPSGHTQAATSFFVTGSLFYKKINLFISALVISALVAISRLYLRVHWLIDVIGGLAIGFIISIIMYFILDEISKNAKRRSLFVLVFFIITSMALIVLNIVELIRGWGDIKIESTYKILSVFGGCSLGFFLEDKIVKFSNKNSFIKKTIVFILGIGTTLFFMIVLKKVFPDKYLFDTIRYFFIGVWITFLYPLLCLNFKLFSRG
ncbi:MAG: phosphatase PAP2 family protein [Spirochaetes bacterium]|nr:phosphatase PAP2 family protein [Spirochaetota bacterium]